MFHFDKYQISMDIKLDQLFEHKSYKLSMFLFKICIEIFQETKKRMKFLYDLRAPELPKNEKKRVETTMKRKINKTVTAIIRNCNEKTKV